MFAFGAGYRATAAWLDAPVTTDPVTQETLDRLPLQIGEWTGLDKPIDPEVLEKTDADAHLSRQYSRNHGLELVSLWVASGVQVRDLTPHRPEVCYRASGHTMTSKREMELALGSDESLPCNVMQFTHKANRVVVLHYYIVDGQYCQDVSQFRFRIFDRVGYLTQVQIVASVAMPRGLEATEEMLFDFAAESAPLLIGVFEAFKGDDRPEN